jgi:tagaturonate reductase
MPLLVYFISKFIFGADPDTVSGFVLLYAVPTAILGFIWTSIFRGNYALALTLILLDSVLAPIMVPATIRLLVGTSVNINVSGMIIALIFMVVIPTILGVSMNELSRGKIPNYFSPWFNPLAKVCIFVVVAANSAAVAPQLRLDNLQIWLIFAVCSAISVLGFICGKLTGLVGKLTGKLNQETQATILFAVGLKNISAALTLAIEFFPAAVALPAVMGILFQQTNAAIMGRIFLGKVAKDDENVG